MKFNTKTRITSAESHKDNTLAFIQWTTPLDVKTLYAKKIKAKLHPNDKKTNAPSDFNKSLESFIATGLVRIEYTPHAESNAQNYVLTAQSCQSKEHTIVCTGNVSLQSQDNVVTGDIGIYDFEKNTFKITSLQSSPVTAILMSTDLIKSHSLLKNHKTSQ